MVSLNDKVSDLYWDNFDGLFENNVLIHILHTY